MTVNDLKRKIRRLTRLAWDAGGRSAFLLSGGRAQSSAELFDAELAKFEQELDAYIVTREAAKVP